VFQILRERRHVGVSHLQVRRRGDFRVWRGVQKGEVTDRSRGSRETGELSFHMRRARLNSIPFCEVSPGKSSGECDMAVYLSLPKTQQLSTVQIFLFPFPRPLLLSRVLPRVSYKETATRKLRCATKTLLILQNSSLGTENAAFPFKCQTRRWETISVPLSNTGGSSIKLSSLRLATKFNFGFGFFE
jgi:hypothetical protein